VLRQQKARNCFSDLVCAQFNSYNNPGAAEAICSGESIDAADVPVRTKPGTGKSAALMGGTLPG
jgi:hypothetical protein